jgi:hypothetical protein
MATALARILGRGYFPKELPPPFQTLSFAAAVDAGLPPSFELLLTRPTRANPAFITSPGIHNLARAGTLRRRLSIPNPVNQYQLAAQVVAGWREIARFCRRSPISLTTPTFKVPGARPISAAKGFAEIPAARARARAGSRFILSTDLNAFYPSVYTHAIPWALHTKSVAKRDRGNGLLGNRLDLALRNGQSGQTIGIPIGPDTSLVIAELLGTAVDLKLPEYVRRHAFRYIDDVECGFMNASDAEGALAAIQNEFAAFELSLNPRKTRVSELPQDVEAFWVPHLRLFRFEGSGQRLALLGFFGRAFELAKQHPQEAILKYAVQRMRSVTVSNANWSLYEDLLLGCLAIESGTTPAVVAELNRYRATRPLSADRITEVFNRLIAYHAPQHHGSEVAWSIWYLTISGYRISGGVGDAAVRVPDPVVSLCLLHARSLGLVDPGVDWSVLERQMTKEELLGPNWLLSYEARVKGWLPSRGAADHIAAVPQFAHLRGQGVTFYELAATLASAPLTASAPPAPVAPAARAAPAATAAQVAAEVEEDDHNEEDEFDYILHGLSG